MKKLLFCLLVCTSHIMFAQEAIVILKTNRAAGMPMKLELRVLSPESSEIDWGDGKKIKYNIETKSTIVQGILSGEFIKIYAKKIIFLSCSNLDIVSVDVSKAIELQQLYCDKNDLTALDLTCNSKLVRLGAHTNKLSDLDLSKNPKLTGLYLQNNQFDSRALNRMFNAVPILKNLSSNINFRITNNPGAMSCNTSLATNKKWNLDTEGDGSGGGAIKLTTKKSVGEDFLIELRLSTAGYIEINWGEGPILTNVSTETTRVKGRLESGNVVELYGDNIVFLKCEGEQLVDVDVSLAKNLQQIYLGRNELSRLNLQENINLVRLGCNANKITELNLRNNERLSGLYLQNNQMDACALDDIYSQIKKRTKMSDNVNLRITGNSGAQESKTSIATAKNWNVDVVGVGNGCE